MDSSLIDHNKSDSLVVLAAAPVFVVVVFVVVTGAITVFETEKV